MSPADGRPHAQHNLWEIFGRVRKDRSSISKSCQKKFSNRSLLEGTDGCLSRKGRSELVQVEAHFQLSRTFFVSLRPFLLLKTVNLLPSLLPLGLLNIQVSKAFGPPRAICQ